MSITTKADKIDDAVPSAWGVSDCYLLLDRVNDFSFVSEHALQMAKRAGHMVEHLQVQLKSRQMSAW